jgi:hypothetical protein
VAGRGRERTAVTGGREGLPGRGSKSRVGQTCGDAYAGRAQIRIAGNPRDGIGHPRRLNECDSGEFGPGRRAKALRHCRKNDEPGTPVGWRGPHPLRQHGRHSRIDSRALRGGRSDLDRKRDLTAGRRLSH